MNWTLKFLPEAQKDLKNLVGNERILVSKAIKKVIQNPVSIYEGGYGKPLGNKNDTDLTGFYKIKLRGAELRIVYKLIKTDTEMIVVVIGASGEQFKDARFFCYLMRKRCLGFNLLQLVLSKEKRTICSLNPS